MRTCTWRYESRKSWPLACWSRGRGLERSLSRGVKEELRAEEETAGRAERASWGLAVERLMAARFRGGTATGGRERASAALRTKFGVGNACGAVSAAAMSCAEVVCQLFMCPSTVNANTLSCLGRSCTAPREAAVRGRTESKCSAGRLSNISSAAAKRTPAAVRALRGRSTCSLGVIMGGSCGKSVNASENGCERAAMTVNHLIHVSIVLLVRQRQGAPVGAVGQVFADVAVLGHLHLL